MEVVSEAWGGASGWLMWECKMAHVHSTSPCKQCLHLPLLIDLLMFLFCSNETSEEVDLCWFYEGGEHPSGTIQPGSNLYVGGCHCLLLYH